MEWNSMYDLVFNGQQLVWHGRGKFKATSGFAFKTENFQLPKYQCVSETGPVPEGHYYIPVDVN
jgi:hypothetical protein